MPGFTGRDTVGWGGKPGDGINGWSARALHISNPDFVQMGYYVYHVDQPPKWGSEWKWGWGAQRKMESEKWYRIDEYVKINEIDKSDGILRAWVDDKLVFEKTTVKFRTVPGLKVKGYWFNVYEGGEWTATQDMDVYFDDLVISSKPTGKNNVLAK